MPTNSFRERRTRLESTQNEVELLERLSEVEFSLEEALENASFAESFAAMAYGIQSIDNDETWKLLGSAASNQHFTLDQLKGIAEKTREHTIGNPLLGRAMGLRSANVFGKPFEVKTKTEISKRIRNILEDPTNEAVIGSVSAWMRNERTAFTDGNVFLMYNRETSEWSRVPLDEIRDVITAPDNPERVRYYLRTYEVVNNLSDPMAPTQFVSEWIPVDSYKASGRKVTKIGETPVSTQKVIVDAYPNSDSGQTFGVPDALAALPWAALYREYLKDGAKVIKALASIAWVLKNKTSEGTKKSAQKVPVGGVAATANMTDNMDLSAMPRSNQVDLNTGRALAAMVATACEVSVVALLSDPGQSGAYGTAKTLDPPTEQAAMARQQYWRTIIRRVYRVMGYLGEFDVWFPPISEDPDYRKVASLAQMWDRGLLTAEEGRLNFSETMKLKLLQEDLPQHVVIPGTAEGLAVAAASSPAPAASRAPVGGRGVSTGVGDISSGDNSARDDAA